MRKLKKLLALALVVCMVCAVSTTAWAEDSPENDDPKAEISKQAPDYYSSDYQMFIKDNIQASNEYVLNKPMTRSGAQKFLSVPLVKQSETYYCGPAVAEMIVNYKRNPKTQAQLATDAYCGTDSDGETFVFKLTNGLNKVLGSGTYTYVNTSDQTFGSALIYSIDKSYPVACHIRTEYLTSYQGNGFGHYVAAIGYRYGFVGATSENDVRYNDPHYDSRYFGEHTIDWREMEDAIDGNAGLFIRKS